ncbi:MULTISPECIES: ribosome-inactivating family protein [unclassified Kitasatospora]|uniref:ribosome-inactivating family protein n=1 Tax=unclassified Kitasatospora TaxID=2633591 RepID=UPI0034087EBD
MLKKIWSALLSTAMAAGLVAALGSPAHATDEKVTAWNVSNITSRGAQHAQNYWSVIDFIHRNSYGNDTSVPRLRQTTTERHLIQVRVMDGNDHLTSLYLWSDNLYVAGFYSPVANQHFVFADGRTQQFQTALEIRNARIMPNTGNYTALPGGNNRENLVLEPETIYNAMQTLHRATEYNDNVGRALLIAIQLFSEASRFAPIFDNIRTNIRDWTHHPLGGANADLENQWGRISDFANAVGVHGESRQITVLGHVVWTLTELVAALGFVELNGGQSRL